MKDYTGMRKGRLVALKYVRQDKNNRPVWLFQCDCGKQVEYEISAIRPYSTTISCGCANAERRKSGDNHRKHGGCGTRLYRIWEAMKARCYCPSSKALSQNMHYRGITVCDEWRNSFVNFRDWALANGYADDLSIDRIDNSKGYSPENCRWATVTQQANNKSNNHKVIINGEPHPLKEACKMYGISIALYYKRIREGFSEEAALTTPKRG